MPRLPLAVATSKPTYSATRILEHFGLARHFSFIGGSDLEGTRHDKAAVIEHTMAELALLGLPSTPDALVMVGDREHDVLGARAHGIDTIGVLWGYGDADELLGAGASGAGAVTRRAAAAPGAGRPLDRAGSACVPRW